MDDLDQECALAVEAVRSDVEAARRRLGLTRCFYCGTHLTLDDEGVWIDDTEGDCCSGDPYTGTNENEQHTPYKIDAWAKAQAYRAEHKARRRRWGL